MVVFVSNVSNGSGSGGGSGSVICRFRLLPETETADNMQFTHKSFFLNSNRYAKKQITTEPFFEALSILPQSIAVYSPQICFQDLVHR